MGLQGILGTVAMVTVGIRHRDDGRHQGYVLIHFRHHLQALVHTLLKQKPFSIATSPPQGGASFFISHVSIFYLYASFILGIKWVIIYSWNKMGHK